MVTIFLFVSLLKIPSSVPGSINVCFPCLSFFFFFYLKWGWAEYHAYGWINFTKDFLNHVMIYNQEFVLSWTKQIFPFVLNHPNDKAKSPSLISFVSYKKLIEVKMKLDLWGSNKGNSFIYCKGRTSPSKAKWNPFEQCDSSLLLTSVLTKSIRLSMNRIIFTC